MKNIFLAICLYLFYTVTCVNVSALLPEDRVSVSNITDTYFANHPLGTQTDPAQIWEWVNADFGVFDRDTIKAIRDSIIIRTPKILELRYNLIVRLTQLADYRQQLEQQAQQAFFHYQQLGQQAQQEFLNYQRDLIAVNQISQQICDALFEYRQNENIIKNEIKRVVVAAWLREKFLQNQENIDTMLCQEIMRNVLEKQLVQQLNDIKTHLKNNGHYLVNFIPNKSYFVFQGPAADDADKADRVTEALVNLMLGLTQGKKIHFEVGNLDLGTADGYRYGFVLHANLQNHGINELDPAVGRYFPAIGMEAVNTNIIRISVAIHTFDDGQNVVIITFFPVNPVYGVDIPQIDDIHPPLHAHLNPHAAAFFPGRHHV